MTTSQFSDDDSNADTVQSHVVKSMLTTGGNGFNDIGDLGMAFGQVIITSPFGVNIFTVSFSDNFESPWSVTQTDSFLVTINRMPYANAAGTAYVFENIDPDDAEKTDYFDDLFPWLIDDY